MATTDEADARNRDDIKRLLVDVHANMVAMISNRDPDQVLWPLMADLSNLAGNCVEAMNEEKEEE